jgi:hypothetical protein
MGGRSAPDAGRIKIKTTSSSGDLNSRLNMTGGGALVGARFAF